MTVPIFVACLLFGLGCGALDAALSPLRERAGLVFTVLSDVLLAFLAVGLHFLVLYFLSDGRIFFYAVAAQVVGFFIARATLLWLLRLFRARRRKPQQTLEKAT